jgi:hypothetical protein
MHLAAAAAGDTATAGLLGPPALPLGAACGEVSVDQLDKLAVPA